jgi:hypothetical protein
MLCIAVMVVGVGVCVWFCFCSCLRYRWRWRDGWRRHTPPHHKFLPNRRVVDFSNNEIESAGAIFSGFAATHTVTVDLSGNYLTEDDVTSVLNSFQWSEAALTLDFSRNNVENLPPYMLAGVATRVSTYGVITLILRENPIIGVSAYAFGATPTSPAYVRELTVDMSSPTALLVYYPESRFDFSSVSWDPGSASALTVNAANSSIALEIIQVLGSAWTAGGAPSTLSLNFNLSRNGYARLSICVPRHPHAPWPPACTLSTCPAPIMCPHAVVSIAHLNF